jgi:hypothetical protein
MHVRTFSAELPYPCDDAENGETQDLQCFSCKNAKSLKDCDKNGAMETCTGADVRAQHAMKSLEKKTAAF